MQRKLYSQNLKLLLRTNMNIFHLKCYIPINKGIFNDFDEEI